MSTASAPVQDPADTLCASCGAEMADDQEWCLECGGARTVIHTPPDWRIPVAVVVIVVAIALGGFLIALINLSNDANRAATLAGATPTTPTTSAPTTVTTASAPASTTPPAALGTWATGLPGWTVVLASSHSQSVADATAQRLAAAGVAVGVLDSSQHPSLAPGYWVVFSGRYPSRALASAASTRLVAAGQPTAHPRLIGRPGG